MRALHFVAFALVVLGSALRAQEPQAFRAVSFNIRYGTAPDGEHAWPHRRELVIETIRELAPAVLGVQEALHFQIEAIEDAFPSLTRLGVGRDGGERGEYSALFVDPARFEIEASGTFWLSPDPEEVGSKSWDAALPRICTWADLKDRNDGGVLRVLNTHFDHRGKQARLESAKLLVERRGERPALILGDLNAGETSAPLRTLREGGFADTLRLRWPDATYVSTFNGFRGSSRGAKIDFVLCDARFLVHEAVIHRRADGKNPSDHDAVWADLVLHDAPLAEEMPVLVGEPWFLTSPPDLGELNGERQEAVDHAIFRADDGVWNLWSCIRGTKVGRVLYAWRGASLESPQWDPVGIAMRAEARFGESLEDWGGQEWIQAPHVIEHAGRHWMFYGGHRSESDACQICLATSGDGNAFERYGDPRRYSRVFVGPGEARDPMVLRIGARWYLYYTGHDPDQRAPCKIYARTSENLLRWSEPVAVCWGGSPGAGKWSAECPFVVQRGGYFYLFRTTDYRAARTWVYRSRDPLDFGRDDDRFLIGTIEAAAPEIVVDGTKQYLSSVQDLDKGIRLTKLSWVPERDAPSGRAFLERGEVLWDFEGGELEGWRIEGEAFASQPVLAESPIVRDQHVGHQGRYYLGTYEKSRAGEVQGDEPTGVLKSPKFRLDDGYLAFLMAGGREEQKLGVFLRRTSDDAVFFSCTGRRSNAMRRVVWDLAEHVGQEAYLEVRDLAKGSWGHVNADDFRFVPR